MTLTVATVVIAGVAIGLAVHGGKPKAVPPLLGQNHTFTANQPLPGRPTSSGGATPPAHATNPLPASVVAARGSRRVFGFVPYWMLDAAGSFDVAGYTTLAYSSIGIEADGALDPSTDGRSDLATPAFQSLSRDAAANHVGLELSVSALTSATVNALCTNAAAQSRLANEAVDLVRSHGFAGLNLDLEGGNAADRIGLTDLVARVKTALTLADPTAALTIDTYASATQPGGFWDVPALTRYVTDFFVMAYQLNVAANGGPTSPLTNMTYPLATTASSYAAVVSPGKVLLGLPAYGEDWATTGGTLAAKATGSPSLVTLGQVVHAGVAIQWDPVTQTAWAAYETAGQWHEAFFEDPRGIAAAVDVADQYGLGGAGIWALGYDGSDAAAVALALNGGG